MKGYAGFILRVDLTRRKVEEEPLSEELRTNFVGGRGINSKILFDEVGPKVEPLAPENKLIFGTSPLSGTPTPSMARYTVTTKSPLTGILGDGNAGGFFSAAIKKAGYDFIIIEGKADTPVYLWIDIDKVEIRKANHLWGKNTWETERLIRDETGVKKARVASIGQAGENLVRIASIMHEERSASRCGVGTVMGSKNLKAIAVHGTKGVSLGNPEAFRTLTKSLYQKIAHSKNYDPFRKYGGIAGTALTDKAGFLAVRNYQQTAEFEGIAHFDRDAVAKEFFTGSKGCFACSIRCSKRYEVKEGPFAGEKGNKIEEGCFTPCGPVCGNANMPSLFRMNNLANQYGIDLIELGQGIATAMEWYEKGIISLEDTDGILLNWGNYDGMIEMIHQVAFRKGFGNLLAEGSVRAAKKLGQKAEACVSHAKGTVMAGIDIRMLKGAALCFATSTRGADHLRGLVPVEFPLIPVMKPEEAERIFGSKDVLNPTSYKKASAAIYYQHLAALMDVLEICRFAMGLAARDLSFDELFKLVTFATGMEIDQDARMKVAERVYNVERAFLVREGITRKDDCLIGKWATETVPNGPYKGEMIDQKEWGKMLNEYYDLRGWDKNGIPTRKKLIELNLKEVADELHLP
jgi:aldehyde:ferredoxin oxidoreductase